MPASSCAARRLSVQRDDWTSTYCFILQDGHLYLWQASLQTSQLFVCWSNSFFIIASPQSPNCRPANTLYFLELYPDFQKLPRRLSTKALLHTNMASSSATSSDKSNEKKMDRDGYLSLLVARYNYCVMRHPILTKSVTRYGKLEFVIGSIFYVPAVGLYRFISSQRSWLL